MFFNKLGFVNNITFLQICGYFLPCNLMEKFFLFIKRIFKQFQSVFSDMVWHHFWIKSVPSSVQGKVFIDVTTQDKGEEVEDTEEQSEKVENIYNLAGLNWGPPIA